MSGWQLAISLVPPVLVVFGLGFAVGLRHMMNEALVEMDRAYLRGMRDHARVVSDLLKNNAARPAGDLVPVVDAVVKHCNTEHDRGIEA